MIYNKYGLCAIKAYELMQHGMDGEVAWKEAASEIFGANTSSAKKSCPKNAFLGIWGLEKRNGKNANYAYKALDVVSKMSFEEIEKIKPSDFWKKCLGMDKKYNGQIDVIFALIDKQYLKV